MLSICTASASAHVAFVRKQIPEPLGTCSCLSHNHNCKYVSCLLNHICPDGTEKTISGILTSSWSPYPFLTIKPSSCCLLSSCFEEVLGSSSLQVPVCHLSRSKINYCHLSITQILDSWVKVECFKTSVIWSILCYRSVFSHALNFQVKAIPNYFLSLVPDLSKNTTIHTNSSLKSFLKFAGHKSIFDGVLTPAAIATFSLKPHITHLISLLANKVWHTLEKVKWTNSSNIIYSLLLMLSSSFC